MQMLTKRMSALALMACLLVALALGGLTAWAADWYGGGNTLTVYPTDNPTIEEDMASSDVVLDIVKIGDATPHASDQAFDYTLTGIYADLPFVDNPTTADWRDLAIKAAEITQTTDQGTVAAGETLENQEDGLYLVLGHSKGETNGLIAHGTLFDYEFQPAIVALPSKAAEPETGEIHTDGSYGSWLKEVEVVLKSEQKPRYGDLKITKTVQDFSGEEATFVFHIVGKTPAGDDYDNYAAITCGASGETTVTHIPAGTKLTVKEEYPSPRYELVEGDTSEKTIVADDVVSAAFVNKKNGSSTQGHGIENNFTLIENGDWILKATPESEE